MAARRSRLQIKPNIGGTPKGPSAKPTLPKSPVKSQSVDTPKSPTVKQPRPKSPVKAPSNETVKTKSNTEERIKSPTRLMSPKRNSVIKSPNPSVVKVKNDKTETSTQQSDNVAKESVDISENSKVVDKIGSPKPITETDKDAEQSKLLTLPARERFRRFGKVNISSARGVKSSSPVKEISDEALEGEKDSGKVDSIISKEKKESEGAKNLVTRSRFPKAKPNLVDAAKRKQKSNIESQRTCSASSTETQSDLPEITVTDTSSDKDHQVASAASETDSTTDLNSTPLVQQQQQQSETQLVQKQPLKAPIPSVFMSPEKRARTQSTTEPPVVKRQKKPKVDAPTDQPPDRTTMKMRDLIRWNPSNNPMKPRAKTTKASNVEKVIEKENVNSEKETSASGSVTIEEPDNALPVPQVTIGPDGNIVINEKSLVVKDPELDKAPSQEDDVIDESDIYTTYRSFAKNKKNAKRWSKKETKMFYKALAMIGIDFFLISQLFPKRTRQEIKQKFKREEKTNRQLVERVLQEGIKFDPSLFDAPLEDNSSEEEMEDDIDKGKKQKNDKEPKNNNKEPKKKQKKQSTAKKKSAYKRNKTKNYFDGESTTEDEEEPPQKKTKNSSDSPWQPPSLSKKDGEVAGILMDLSKDGGQSESDVDFGNGSEKYTAVPIQNLKSGGRFVKIADHSPSKESRVLIQNNKSHVNEALRKRVLKNTNNSAVTNVPVDIPGVESISIMQTQQVYPNELNQSDLAIQNTGQTSNNRRVILPIINSNTNSTACSPNQTTATSSQGQYGMRSLINNQVPQFAGENQVQITLNAIPNMENPESSGAEDQYVLVTVVPEGGGETVIHIYKLHGSQTLMGETNSLPTEMERFTNNIQNQVIDSDSFDVQVQSDGSDSVSVREQSVNSDAVSVQVHAVGSDSVSDREQSVNSDAVSVQVHAVGSDSVSVREQSVNSDAVSVQVQSVGSDSVSVREQSVDNDAVCVQVQSVGSDSVYVREQSVDGELVNVREQSNDSISMNVQGQSINIDSVSVQEHSVDSDSVSVQDQSNDCFSVKVHEKSVDSDSVSHKEQSHNEVPLENS